jgi:hypothetical protein
VPFFLRARLNARALPLVFCPGRNAACSFLGRNSIHSIDHLPRSQRNHYKPVIPPWRRGVPSPLLWRDSIDAIDQFPRSSANIKNPSSRGEVPRFAFPLVFRGAGRSPRDLLSACFAANATTCYPALTKGHGAKPVLSARLDRSDRSLSEFQRKHHKPVIPNEVSRFFSSLREAEGATRREGSAVSFFNARHASKKKAPQNLGAPNPISAKQCSSA